MGRALRILRVIYHHNLTWKPGKAFPVPYQYIDNIFFSVGMKCLNWSGFSTFLLQLSALA